MNTTFWGPDGWKFLHTLTFMYPETPNSDDKIKMKNFMNSICFVLPCKYCRLSFTKYMKSLPIDDHLDSRDLCIEWLYKIHNKVNKKLRIQGFCKHSNPELEYVKTLYNKPIKHIYEILNNNKKEQTARVKNVINYICNSGYIFLGCIVFNYQGYFTNCHTSKEKTVIVTVYNNFFNSIIPLICSYLSKFCKDGKDCVSRYTIPKFNIRHILLSNNEPYSKLIKWFYKCEDLCTMEEMYKTEDYYLKHFNKHIVMSCNNPIMKNTKKIKSCRYEGFSPSSSLANKKKLTKTIVKTK
jgi:hypothetical protein